MKSITLLTLLIFSLFFSMQSYATETVFYILRSNSPAKITSMENSLESLKKNYHAINILISQAYQIDENGIVSGFIDNDVIHFTKDHSIKLMALVTNVGFDKEKVKKFLGNPEAQKKALDTILTSCQKNHYYGVQFDFEMVALDNRDQLTEFYKNAANLLHQAGFKVSFAIAPVVSEGPFNSDFLKAVYTNWQGAYDLQTLNQYCDFVTVMTYNQHAGKTTPGPTATTPWMEAVIKNLLQYIPAEKISLGIPVYSGYWSTGKNPDDPDQKITAYSVGIDYEKASYLLKKFNGKLIWNSKNQFNYSFFENNWLFEYLFIEDAKSFQAKLALAKKCHLRGISVFYIGIEDPHIWPELA